MKRYDNTTCRNCGGEVEETSPWFTFNLQNGYEKMIFCSKACLNSWVKRKKFGLAIALILGAVLVAALFVDMGLSAVAFFFIPYTIRQLHSGLGKLGLSGWFGEFIAIFAVLIGSFTLIYPLYKLIQEIKSYRRIKTLYS